MEWVGEIEAWNECVLYGKFKFLYWHVLIGTTASANDLQVRDFLT
jgi:hypothetical protein